MSRNIDVGGRDCRADADGRDGRGLLVGLMQALTQIQDQTVAFVPKILAMAAVLVACLPWLVVRMVDFTRTVFENAGGP